MPKHAVPTPRRTFAAAAAVAAVGLAATSCARGEPASKAPAVVASPSPAGAAAGATTARPPIERDVFNRMAVRENLALYWASDANADKVVDPAEVASLLFYGAPARWVDGGRFTPEFDAAYARIVRAAAAADKAYANDERKRLVVADLDGAMPTLVRSDFRNAPAAEKAFIEQMIVVARAVDALYALQTGASAVAPHVPETDVESRSLFRRNWGPRCVTPQLEKNGVCRAAAVEAVTDVYPAELQKNPKFCAEVEKHPNAKALLDPFVVVRDNAGKLEAVGYAEKYKSEMGVIAKELRAAAALVKAPEEAKLRAYLEAAAQSFTTNDWRPADEAWAQMNATNSKYYVRIAPDETYWEPCSRKAGFHMDFARINRDSLVWQEKLDPLKDDMEKALAKLAGPPYKARHVAFHLPDFIDVIFNSGDSRNAIGATIGQSLPNWGVVANEGRGRTVAMSNLYTDPDNLRIKRTKASTLFTKAIVDGHDWNDPAPSLFTTVLHEAAHNLGPAHEYKVDGKTDGAAFGGGLASMLEELKAQSAALYYIEYLRTRGVIDDALARKGYIDSINWGFGHIARGMWTDGGQRKAYSQLAAIQLGFFLDAKAITFDAHAVAANGVEKGAFDVKLDKLPAAVAELMTKVASIKARGDRAGAEALAKRYTDEGVVPHAAIAQRVLKFPQVSFVYGVDL